MAAECNLAKQATVKHAKQPLTGCRFLQTVFPCTFVVSNGDVTLLSGGVPGSVLCYCVPDLHALQEHIRLGERHIPRGVPVGASHWVVLPGELCFHPTGGKQVLIKYFQYCRMGTQSEVHSQEYN